MNDLEIVIRGKNKIGKSTLAFFLGNQLDELLDEGKVSVHSDPYDDRKTEQSYAKLGAAEFIRRLRQSGRSITIRTETI